MSLTNEATPIRLDDYSVPDFSVDSVNLRVELGCPTRVTATLQVRRNPAGRSNSAFVLDGVDLKLERAAIDGVELSPERYELGPETLTIRSVPDAFTFESRVTVSPESNTSLEGLYYASDIFCTQCEAEGFRKIAYHFDRPDVLARYTTTVIGDRVTCPVLLSNGNPIHTEALEDGRHLAVWEDPFPKPSYLFALVAGDLEHLEDHFRTASGMDVTLRIYTTPANIDKCEHAMVSLKKSMLWDEEVFGLECDLERYNVVVTDDFNMGAMENKGLNVFNSKYVLARPETATDADYAGIEGVIGHEYFHNWTGNRVTCRDWFQLSLKEGLTVFRDQEFSAAMGSPAVKRIEDVRNLMARQFPEDAGPMAHPVRPQEVIEINNFYTVTVYEKGAEVVRMYHTMLGADAFRRGVDLYFERHDGQAVTCSDFLHAMEAAGGVDLSQFERWYSQAGTPALTVSSSFDAASRLYTLQVAQHIPVTPGQAEKLPTVIPLRLGLLGADGTELDLQLDGETEAQGTSRVVLITESEQLIRFVGVADEPVPSLLRGFSAPVKLSYPYSDAQLAFLMGHDTDSYCRWAAAQELATRVVLAGIEAVQKGRELGVPEHYVEAARKLLGGDDDALIAEALALPDESYLADQMPVVDVDSIHRVREFVRARLGEVLGCELRAAVRRCVDRGAYRFESAQVARRSLRAVCLGLLVAAGDDEGMAACLGAVEAGQNMTEQICGLSLLVHYGSDEAEWRRQLEAFYERWQTDSLVVDKWLRIQAQSPRPGTLEVVLALIEHESFQRTNPNKVRALIGALTTNSVHFHRADGAGYRFLADEVIALDAINPQIAARLVGAFNQWRRYDEERKRLMRTELERIVGTKELSKDVFEIASKALS